MKPSIVAERYGPWAVVAGASQGLGEAFARELARMGINVVIVARREEKLRALADSIEASEGVGCRTIRADLAAPDSVVRIDEATSDLDVGLFVYNAAYVRPGRTTGLEDDTTASLVAVNCGTPYEACRRFGARMESRGRGGIILMSSMAGLQGTAYLAGYAASKAFLRVLAESLWDELGEKGVDVIACIGGSIDTPGYRSDAAGRKDPAPVLEPSRVVKTAIAALGKRPTVIPGAFYKVSAFLMQRLLPRRTVVRIMSRATRKIYARNIDG